MAIRSSSRGSTPRRSKIWAVYNNTITLGAGTGTPKATKLLDDIGTDLGIANLYGVTVMRMVGAVKLVIAGAAATPTFQRVGLGFAWLDRRVADAGVGDGQIPRPLQPGALEAVWIQQGEVEGNESSSATYAGAGAQAAPPEDCVWKFDITQMRKQPHADSELCLVQNGGGSFEADTMNLNVRIQMLLALP